MEQFYDEIVCSHFKKCCKRIFHKRYIHSIILLDEKDDKRMKYYHI